MAGADKALIIIPTYNEIQNISRIIEEIFKSEPRIHILILDDSSPDGTADAVKSIMKSNRNIHLIERPGKMGLGSAYITGFKFALEKGYEYIFEMDADFSHNPAEIPNFLKAIQENDMVLGSRYIKGVNVVNWPLKRLLLSYYANMYTRLVTGMPVRDATGGFKCFRRKVLENIDFSKISSNGYAFQIELTFKAWRKGFKIYEIPIIFIDRVFGESKLSGKIMWEAFFLVWRLRIAALFNKQ
ncbi:MAG: polyprenol monophosphomannose synthase [Calditrichaceae bacterium]|nr:polyprenol monophosphomannose synthase [Calditrichaceae bacterium]MBN2709189.1 polyprenol monophosphomannose synthase [Calditrichaceae bacterium]RQV96145.1 MAG: polyprenol monophosphomannose synthase [Calditrichota bacterium]